MSRWNLPDAWEWTTAGDIADVVGGGTPKASDPTNFAAAGFPWLTPADLSDYEGEYIRAGARSLSPKGLSESSARPLPAGTVLYTSRAPIGYCVIAANEIATNQGFKSLVLKDGIDPRFIRYYLLASKDYAESLASGSTFKELSGSRMAELEVPLPPLPEQRRIATRIDELQARTRRSRGALEGVPALLGQLRQSVLASAFRGDLTADWRESHPDKEPASVLLERIRAERQQIWEEAERRGRYREPIKWEDAALPQLPEKWVWATFDECSAEITVGHVGPMRDKYVDTGVPFLRSQNVRPLRYDPLGLVFIPPTFHEELQKSRLCGGEILTVRSGANTGDCCVYPEGSPEANCADLVITRPLRGLDPVYAAAYISSPEGRRRLSLGETGMAQAHFNVGAMRRKVFPLPPYTEQLEIVRRITGLLRAANAVKERTEAGKSQVTAQDESILSRAFRGELVPQDPNDEPASVLLERIRQDRDQQRKRGRKF